jgi:hypothetical protein
MEESPRTFENIIECLGVIQISINELDVITHGLEMADLLVVFR